jgi:hypothetical protein
MKLLYFLLFTAWSFAPSNPTADPIDDIAALLRQANVNGLSRLFADNIEITILTDDNVYSKAQAGVILDKFFIQNKPLSVKILHKVNSKGSYRFGVVILTTEKGTYRVACTLKGTENNMSLIEMRIEAEKVR